MTGERCSSHTPVFCNLSIHFCSCGTQISFNPLVFLRAGLLQNRVFLGCRFFLEQRVSIAMLSIEHLKSYSSRWASPFPKVTAPEHAMTELQIACHWRNEIIMYDINSMGACVARRLFSWNVKKKSRLTKRNTGVEILGGAGISQKGFHFLFMTAPL
jgi:hypothetical protein